MKTSSILPLRSLILALGCVGGLAVGAPAVALAKEQSAGPQYARGAVLVAASSEREPRRREAQEARPPRDSRSPEVLPQRQGGPGIDPNVQDNRRSGQLSPDERRALRREIDDVGRDVYRAPRGNR